MALRAFVSPMLAVSLLAAPGIARADTTPEQAQALEGQFRNWLTTITGPYLAPDDRPLRISPEGDHFKLEIPIASAFMLAGLDAGGATVTGEARPMGEGRWSIDNMRVSTPLRVAPAAGAPGPAWSMKIGEQTMHAVIDPSLATTSSLDATIADQTTVVEGSKGGQLSHIGKSGLHVVWAALGGGRMNVTANGSAEKIGTSQVMPDGTLVTWSADSIKTSGHADGVAMDGFGAMAQTIRDLMSSATGGPDGTLSADAKKQAHTLVTALAGLLSGMEMEETIEGLRVDAAGQGGTLQTFTLGIGAGAPEDKLDVHMTVGLAGLDSPQIPRGPVHTLLPKRIALKPYASGLPTKALLALLTEAIDTDGADSKALEKRFSAMLRKDPLTLGFDDLAIDLGPAMLTGDGSIDVSGTDDYSGEAELTMKGFDRLMKLVNATPELKDAVPVLMMLKGLGKQDGDETSWNIAYENNKVTVNDTDLSAMMGGGGNRPHGNNQATARKGAIKKN